MKTYLIQRNVPNAGQLSAMEKKRIAVRSCQVLDELQQTGPYIQWLQSYITDNNLWCVYKAENEEIIREHGRRGNFPVDAIFQIHSLISPATAETAVQ